MSLEDLQELHWDILSYILWVSGIPCIPHCTEQDWCNQNFYFFILFLVFITQRFLFSLLLFAFRVALSISTACETWFRSRHGWKGYFFIRSVFMILSFCRFCSKFKGLDFIFINTMKNHQNLTHPPVTINGRSSLPSVRLHNQNNNTTTAIPPKRPALFHRSAPNSPP